MPCRVGMTTDLAERKRYWETQYPNLKNWQVLHRNLTYDEAIVTEKQEAQDRNCEAAAGGERVPGGAYSIYYFEW